MMPKRSGRSVIKLQTDMSAQSGDMLLCWGLRQLYMVVCCDFGLEGMKVFGVKYVDSGGEEQGQRHLHI
jgi:hypothetical protein